MSRAAAFRQADLTRAIRAVQAAGIVVARAEIDANGKIVIVSAAANDLRGPSSWDRVLPS